MKRVDRMETERVRGQTRRSRRAATETDEVDRMETERVRGPTRRSRRAATETDEERVDRMETE